MIGLRRYQEDSPHAPPKPWPTHRTAVLSWHMQIRMRSQGGRHAPAQMWCLQ